MKTFTNKQLLALHYVYPLRLNRFNQLLNEVTSLKDLEYLPANKLQEILRISLDKSHKILTNYRRMLNYNLQDAYTHEGIHVIPFTESLYPKQLFDLIDPPVVLYAKGDISLLQSNKVAIIGSRKATDYSARALQSIVPPLVEKGIVIVSGLARGADTMAHKAAIRYGGKTIGVLGHGFFHLYPKENKSLAEEMAKHHLLITEFPPYIGPERWNFPLRNRIISGISRAIVVTEAALKSGTLITTDHALEHGKDVFVVPGPIDSKESLGTNSLLREGAIPIWNGEQILNELKLLF